MKTFFKFISALTVFLFVFSGPLSTLPVLAEGETYTITFNPISGTVPPGSETKTVTAGGTYGTLPDAVLDGYNFLGWFTDTDGGVKITPETSVTITDDQILYAQWTTHDYTITYNLDEGTNSPDNPATYTINSPDIHLTDPARDGYSFDGWTSDTITTPTKDAPIPSGSTGDLEFTAHWTAKTYTVTFDANGGTVTPDSGSVIYDQPYGTLPTPSLSGYDSQGWFTDKTAGTEITSDTTVKITDDQTLYVHWASHPYTITYNLDGGTNDSANLATYTIESPDIHLVAPTKDGYTFDGWTSTGNLTPETDVTIPHGSVGTWEFTAHWTVIPYTITYHMDSGTNNAANPATYNTESQDIHLVAPTRTGYTFAGWTGTGITGDPVLTVTISQGSTGNLEYTAHWTLIPIGITGITLSGPSKIGIGAACARTITATIAPLNATNQTLTWTSSDTSIATVDNTGVVTGVKAGAVTITATAADGSGKKGTISITVTTAKLVQQIVISGQNEIGLGKSVQLAAAVTPAKPANKKLLWSSSDTTIATVNASGKVTAKKAGTATITAASTDGSAIKGTFSITVMPHAATSVTITGAKVIDLAAADKTTQLSAVVNPSDASQLVTWTSGSKKIATVNAATGKVTGLKAGTVTITAAATDGSGKKATYKITVTTLAKSITVSGSTEVATGKKIQLTASVSPATTANKKVTWSSSNTAVATVSAAGLVTAMAVASDTPVTITATAADGSLVKADYPITVKAIAATQVNLIYTYHDKDKGKDVSTDVTGQPFGMMKGDSGTLQLNAVILPAEASQNLVWSSTNTKVATVTQNGLVTSGSGTGTATITAATTDGSGKKAYITFNIVTIHATSVTISGPHKVKAGKSVQLKAKVSPSNASIKKVIWEAVDFDAYLNDGSLIPTDAVTVNSSGKVTASKNVTDETYVIIVAMSADGYTGGMYFMDVLP